MENNQFYAHPTAIVSEDAEIGVGSKIWHFTHVMKNAKLGKSCNVGQNVFIAEDVVCGSNVKIQNNVSIYKGVECEDDVFLGPSMVFTNVINPRSAVNRRSQYLKTVVKKGATIGANATIVCGNDIGEYAFIGAGTVITKEVKPYELWVGNPGKRIGWMSEYGHRLKFNTKGKARCPESGDTYSIDNEIVKKDIS